MAERSDAAIRLDDVVGHVLADARALIMVHGDDRGLRMPPKLAPLEAVIVPIVKGASEDVVAAARELHAGLKRAGFRVKLDERDERPGFKFADWEMSGVPLRIELGANDLAAGTATVVRRDRERGEGGAKTSLPLGEVAAALPGLLASIGDALFAQAKAYLAEHTIATLDREQFFTLLRERAGMIDIPWCNRPECETVVKAETKANTRNLRPLEGGETVCVACGEPAVVRAYFAQSY
jgi:prolyl-tRNA synthetase